MPKDFQERLFPLLPGIIKQFGTPFYIHDEVGIRDNCRQMNLLLGSVSPSYRNFYAVKANPVPRILKIVSEEGMGFDCSSTPELVLARIMRTKPDGIMFSSNNTSAKEYAEAFADGGCILNLDDLDYLRKIPQTPEMISFRYNPGSLRDGNEIIGRPEEAKYGVRDDLIVEAYRQALNKGIKQFGLHTMICSNQRDYRYMVQTVKMILEVADRLYVNLGIRLKFVNIGGGFGIPYKPDDQTFDLQSFAGEAKMEFLHFQGKCGFCPSLFTECGRYVTGPFGVLVTEVINRPTSKYKNYVGVDACMANLMRPGMYGAYHHVYVEGDNNGKGTEVADVVGSLCENCDKFTIDRNLSITKEGDRLIIANGGAHASAMGFNYNGRLACQELLLREDGVAELIRRAETTEDYFSTFIF